MKYLSGLAAALLASAVPVTAAMSIQPDDRELYATSIRCTAYFSILIEIAANVPENFKGPEDRKEDRTRVESRTKLFALAGALADGDSVQIDKDLQAETLRLDLLRENGVADDLIKLDKDCRGLPSHIDAILAEKG